MHTNTSPQSWWGEIHLFFNYSRMNYDFHHNCCAVNLWIVFLLNCRKDPQPQWPLLWLTPELKLAQPLGVLHYNTMLTVNFVELPRVFVYDRCKQTEIQIEHMIIQLRHNNTYTKIKKCLNKLQCYIQSYFFMSKGRKELGVWRLGNRDV